MHSLRVASSSVSLRLVCALVAVTSALAVTVTGVSGRAASAGAAAAAPSHPGIYHPVAPTRALDATAGAGGTLSVALLGSRGVPASGVGAVVLNVTAASPARGGYVTAYPYGATRPPTSNLNFTAGRTVANLVVLPLGTGGRVSLYNASTGSTRLVADVSGYYESGAPTDAGAFGGLTPSRVLDTRSGLGAPASSAVSHGVASVQVAGVGGVPASGVAAVVLNVTVATPQSSGYATVYPSGVARPGTSSLNFPPQRTVANLVTVKLGADGKVNVYNGSAGSVRLVADVFGYYLNGTASRPGAYSALDPARVMDTRATAYPGAPNRVVPSHGVVQLNLSSRGGLPPYGGGAVTLNVTATAVHGTGYVTVYPGGTTRPHTSNLNFAAGSTVANLVVVRPNSAGTISLYNSSSATIQLIADVSGFFLPPTAMHFRTAQTFSHATFPASIACASSTFCLSAAGLGRVARWNGSTWSAPQDLFASADGVVALACPSTTRCVAVSKLGKARFYDGSAWSVAQAIGLASLVSVRSLSCPTTTTCFVGDSAGKVHRYAGSTWATASLTTSAISGLSCSSATFCVAVAEASKSFKFTGTTWTPVSMSLLQGAVVGLSCFSTTLCYLVDEIGEGKKFTGSAWGTGFNSPLGLTDTMSCTTSTFCLVTRGQSARYDGATWTDVLGPGSRVVATSCASPTFCMGVASDGYEYTFDGTTWSAISGIDPAPGTATDVSCPTASFCAIVTSRGAAITGDGTTWSAPRAVTPRSALRAVSCSSATFCLAVTSKVASFYDGTDWSAWFTLDNNGLLTDVSCASSELCMVLTSDGRAFRYADNVWYQPTQLGFSGQAVSCAPDLTCTAAVQAHDVTDFDGTSWSTPAHVDGETLTDLSCLSSDSCVAAETDGQVVVRSALGWGEPEPLTAAGNALPSLSCATSTFCVATVLDESDVFTFDGEVWTNTDENAGVKTAVSCGSPTFCVAVGGAVSFRGTTT